MPRLFGILKNKLLLLTMIFLFVLACVSCYMLWLFSRETFYNGIFVENIELSGMTKHEAKVLIESVFSERYGDKSIQAKHDGGSWTLRMDEITLKPKTDEAIERAYEIGRRGSILERLRQIANAHLNGVYIYAELDFNKGKLEEFLRHIGRNINKSEKDASVAYKNGEISIGKGEEGIELDIDINKKLLENYILNRKFEDISLIVKKKPPRISYGDIKDINSVLSSSSTVFNPRDANRSHNIRLACEKLNGKILLVDDIFSMDRTLGPRTIENGYKEAPVIYKNEFIKGPGGGICQVTTTLYVAVLKAGLEIIERTHHSMPLGYVEPGQDATIAEDSIDFKFQNRLAHSTDNYPVCISSEVEGNRIIIRILGRRNPDNHVIKLKSEIVEEYVDSGEDLILDESIPHGGKIVVQEARKGMKVAVYREIYSMEGVLLKREKISEDVYKPVKARVKVNPSYLDGLGDDLNTLTWGGSDEH